MWREPVNLLRRVYRENFHELETQDCCGFGGSFNLYHYGTSKAVGREKAACIHASGARYVVTSCPGCMLQLVPVANRGAFTRAAHLTLNNVPGLVIKGQSPAQAEARGREVIKLVGMEGFEDYYPRQISGGMQQRVAIARAFVTEPDMLLMDEPFGQLDTSTRFHIENSLIELWQRKKQTIIFVTHNLEEAVYLSERILVCTPKPTTIKKEVLVNHLAHPRDIADPEFVRIRREVTDLVRWW